LGDPSAFGAEEEGEPRRTVGNMSHDMGNNVLIGMLMECDWPVRPHATLRTALAEPLSGHTGDAVRGQPSAPAMDDKHYYNQ